MRKYCALTVAIQLAITGMSLPATAADTASKSEKNTSLKKSSATPPATPEDTLVVTAAQQNLQAPGVSTITADDIRKRPPARDVAELIRTMPGVNLTGNSTSGQRGNNRQIDIRGMGPENTLIMIDGKPITSRNSVRMGWSGDRDTRGDTNWVPPEMIERIDVIRGPAAARYGNGAAGGVVNIITKPSSNTWHGTWSSYFNAPEHKSEGATKRTNFSLTGPLGGDVSFRLWGNLDKTQADARNINEDHRSERTGIFANTIPAGREGVIDKNISGQIRWDFAPLQSLSLETNYSRQGNLYAGDTQNTNTNPLVAKKYGDETNRTYRQTYSLTWTGAWDNGVSANTWAQYEHTRNSRMNEGLSGGVAGMFIPSDDRFVDIDLSDVLLHSEVSLPFHRLFDQNLTLGTEWNQQKMKDSASNTQNLAGGGINGLSDNRSPYSQAQIFSLFAEDNIEVTDSTMLTPALRFDHHSVVGTNWSPSLNLSQGLTDDLTLKMGIARAYKAPNLYQTNPNYLLYSRGQGCLSGGSCYLQGNKDLKAETSINKEIGLEWKRDGYQAGATWFRNDYHNKIDAGYTPAGSSTNHASNIYQWDNTPRAVVEGLEGTLNLPLGDAVQWSNNVTYMLKSKNKETGDRLTIIPQYTLNSTLLYQVRSDLSVQGTFTWYGKQKPKKYNYQGKPTVGPEKTEVSPYSLIGLSATWDATRNVSLTTGVDNVFDKRHWREGNAQTTGGSRGDMYGAGARTYNESGRTWYMSVNTRF